MEGGVATLDDYFSLVKLKHGEAKNSQFQLLGRYRFSIFPTDHLRIQNKHDWHSFGLHITDSETDESAFFSGDTKFDFDAYASKLLAARIIFHDVQLRDQPNPVHALLSEMRTMPSEIRNKTYLYHYDDDWDSPEYAWADDEFAGFVVPQQRYMIFS